MIRLIDTREKGVTRVLAELQSFLILIDIINPSAVHLKATKHNEYNENPRNKSKLQKSFLINYPVTDWMAG